MSGKDPSHQVTWLTFQASGSSLLPCEDEKTSQSPERVELNTFLQLGKTVSIKCEKSNKVLFISRCYWIKQFTTSAPTAMAINTDYQRR